MGCSCKLDIYTDLAAVSAEAVKLAATITKNFEESEV